MPFCEKCGASTKTDSKFCHNCGAPQNPPPQPQLNYPPMPPPPNYSNSIGGFSEPHAFQQPFLQKTAEQIISFIIVGKSKRFGGQEYFTGIITTIQLIFAPMTNNMIKEVTNISRQQAKNKNPGPVPVYPYQQMYLNVYPSNILSQTPGSFAVQNQSIREIKYKLVSRAGDGYADIDEYELKIITDSETLTFYMTKRDEYIARLKQVYLEKMSPH